MIDTDHALQQYYAHAKVRCGINRSGARPTVPLTYPHRSSYSEDSSPPASFRLFSQRARYRAPGRKLNTPHDTPFHASLPGSRPKSQPGEGPADEGRACFHLP